MKIDTCGPDVFRGPHPLTTEDFQQLKDLKIKTILNLEEGWFEFFHGKMDQEFIVALRVWNMIPLHIQFGDVFPPSMSSIDAALDVLRRPDDLPVYVHCMKGVDRTGLVCAAYRVKVQGWPIDEAVGEMLDKGFHLFPYLPLGWIGALREYCK